MMAAANEGAAQGKGKSIGEVVRADQTCMALRKPLQKPRMQSSGQILATSHDRLTPKWWFSKGNVLFQGNLGW